MKTEQTAIETRYGPLLAWLEAHGARFDRCRIESMPGMGTGLVATQDMEEDDPILFVPRDLWITVKTPHTAYGPVLGFVEEEADLLPGGVARLALLLALERERSDSFLAPYFAGLPAPTIPDDLPEEQLADLQSPEMVRWVHEQRDDIAEEHALLAEILPEAFPDLLPEGLCALDTWRWAYGHAMQRSFTTDIEGEEVWVQIPGMGLCNHDGSAANTYYAEEDGWLFEAGQAWREGEQIKIDYGSDKTSIDFFLYYGFVPPDNANDRVRLQLALDEGDPDRAAKHAALEALGLRDQCLVGADGVLPTSFLNAAVIWGLDHDAFNTDALDWSDPRFERRALDSLAAAVRSRLGALPTSLAEDRALLQAPGPGGLARAVVAYRHAFKEALAQAAAAMDVQAADLRAGRREPNTPVPDAPEADVYELVAVTLPLPAGC